MKRYEAVLESAVAAMAVVLTERFLIRLLDWRAPAPTRVGAGSFSAPEDYATVASDDDLFSETAGQEVFRRINACETHLEDLETRFRPIHQYIGSKALHAMGYPEDA